MTEPLWDVEVHAEHGRRAFTVHQRVRANGKAQARQRAAAAATDELAGLGRVVGTGKVQRVTE